MPGSVVQGPRQAKYCRHLRTRTDSIFRDVAHWLGVCWIRKGLNYFDALAIG
jgi:hypothetical protein